MADNSFDARADLEVDGKTYEIFRLDALQSSFDVARLPFSMKVLLENLLRNEDGVAVSKEDIEALASWDAKAESGMSRLNQTGADSRRAPRVRTECRTSSS